MTEVYQAFAALMEMYMRNSKDAVPDEEIIAMALHTLACCAKADPEGVPARTARVQIITASQRVFRLLGGTMPEEA